MTKQPNIQT